MKIEFIDDISCSGQFPYADPNQLVRVYHFDCLQAGKLMHAIQEIIIETHKEICLTGLDFIQPVNCNLTLQVSGMYKGITTLNNKDFVCTLTIEKYKEMVFLLEPFCHKKTRGY
jgi:hypothetical protein